MVEVLGKEEGLKKRCTCRKCGNILAYWPNEVRKHRYSDYTGSSDTVFYIMCPCGEEVTLAESTDPDREVRGPEQSGPL